MPQVLPLFRRYPKLAENLPYVSLCNLPTPVIRLERLGPQIGIDNLFVKQDGLTGDVYGGNKARKLEFTLAEAKQRGVKEVLTFGCVGSNHATATAVYAKRVGLRSISMLMKQPNALYVRRNLLLSYANGAELHFSSGQRSLAVAAGIQQFLHLLKRGKLPMVIPPGGSSALGTVGFVNAAFELVEQIQSGELPEPHRIYVAMGTAGTYVGLKIGLMAAGFDCEVIPVRVVDGGYMYAGKVAEHFSKTVGYLRRADDSFPPLTLAPGEIGIRGDFYGKGYAYFTEEGLEAVRLVQEFEGVKLEGTYTGKAFAALIADAKKGELKGKTVLFWNTHNAVDFTEDISAIDYHDLPRCFHRYFEEEVQEEE